MDAMLFLTFAAIAVACAVNLVLQTHPIASALSLVGVMGSLAVLYLLLGGEFIAAVQLIVYAGAIMVLFVFVIMLLNAAAEKKVKKPALRPVVAVPLVFSFLVLLAYLLHTQTPGGPGVKFGEFTGGGPAEVGRSLFSTYILPFEITSIVILIAILGAVVLARKEI